MTLACVMGFEIMQEQRAFRSCFYSTVQYHDA